jgi:hypothetical protein
LLLLGYPGCQCKERAAKDIDPNQMDIILCKLLFTLYGLSELNSSQPETEKGLAGTTS